MGNYGHSKDKTDQNFDWLTISKIILVFNHSRLQEELRVKHALVLSYCYIGIKTEKIIGEKFRFYPNQGLKMGNEDS